MANSDAFALKNSGLNDFLFAVVGSEINGTPLTILSVLARLGEGSVGRGRTLGPATEILDHRRSGKQYFEDATLSASAHGCQRHCRSANSSAAVAGSVGFDTRFPARWKVRGPRMGHGIGILSDHRLRHRVPNDRAGNFNRHSHTIGGADHRAAAGTDALDRCSCASYERFCWTTLAEFASDIILRLLWRGAVNFAAVDPTSTISPR